MIRLRTIALIALLPATLALAQPSDARAAGAPDPAFFGVNAHDPTSADFRKMASGGIGSYRVTIFWQAVQKEREGPLIWVDPDRVFRHLAEQGIKPLPIVYGTPPFVGKRQDRRLKPPVRSRENRRAWKTFLSASVERYGPGGDFWAENPELADPDIGDWQIWNEQNAQFYWNPRPRIGEYVRLLRMSRRAIDRVDPDANLVLGGMYGYPGGRGVFARRYLNRLYQRDGVKRLFDAVAVHPYGRKLKDVKRQLRAARRVMRRHGDGRAEMWITETGWSTEGDEKNFLVVSERRQRARLRQTMSLALRKREAWNVRGVFWYLWRDFEELGICPWCGGAGLVDRQSRSKPSWRAYRKLIKRSTGP